MDWRDAALRAETDDPGHDLALECDLIAAGFTEAERRAFYVAIGKAAEHLTCAEWGLLDRYETAPRGNAA